MRSRASCAKPASISGVISTGPCSSGFDSSAPSSLLSSSSLLLLFSSADSSSFTLEFAFEFCCDCALELAGDGVGDDGCVGLPFACGGGDGDTLTVCEP